MLRGRLRRVRLPERRGRYAGSTNKEADVMELQDYSGDLVPNLRWQDFSKEALIRLLNESQRALIMMDGFWHTKVAEEFGIDKADAWGGEVWGTDYVKHMVPRIMKAMNISGNDVETYMKYLQVDPGLPLEMWDYRIDLKDKNHAVWTVDRCPSLLFMEREGKGREAVVCQQMEVEAIKGYARYFNPAIKVTPLKLPPRKGPDDLPHCQFEFRLEQ